MDDILIATESSPEDHKLKVHHILDNLEHHDLFLKLEKCSFNIKEVEYLRVIISNGSVKMDPVKVEGIANWPIPKTVKDVQSFRGSVTSTRPLFQASLTWHDPERPDTKESTIVMGNSGTKDL